MPINSGRYIITNVQQRNLATLPDPNDGTPLAAGVRKRNLYEQVCSFSIGKLIIFCIDIHTVACPTSE